MPAIAPLFESPPPARPSSSTLPGSPPLGILPDLGPACQEFTLTAGEWVAFFTDGLSESFDPERRAARAPWRRRCSSAHRFRQAGDVIDALTLGERKHRRFAEPHDDLTLLAFGFQ